MSVNPDPIKQVQKIVFIRKIQRQNHPTVYFNQNPAIQTKYQKQVGIFLDTRSVFRKHLTNTFTKAKKVDLLKKFQNILRRILLAVYKPFPWLRRRNL